MCVVDKLTFKHELIISSPVGSLYRSNYLSLYASAMCGISAVSITRVMVAWRRISSNVTRIPHHSLRKADNLILKILLKRLKPADASQRYHPRVLRLQHDLLDSTSMKSPSSGYHSNVMNSPSVVKSSMTSFRLPRCERMMPSCSVGNSTSS